MCIDVWSKHYNRYGIVLEVFNDGKDVLGLPNLMFNFLFGTIITYGNAEYVEWAAFLEGEVHNG